MAPRAGAPARTGLPGWAIALIVGGVVCTLAVFAAAAIATAAVFGLVIEKIEAMPGRVTVPGETSQEVPPPGSSTADPAPQEDEAAAAIKDAEHIIETVDDYLAASRDGSIFELVPDGENVDPDYVRTYLYAISDLRSAVRFTPPSADTAAQLREYATKLDQFEERFLAGEDLDIEVEIVREDGSVFSSDGKYRTRDE